MAFDPQEAVEFLRLVGEVESTNRADGVEDMRFSAGEQWPVQIQNSRNLESRPCLTINKIDAYIRQVTNAQRQQRPQIKVHPLDGTADLKIAEIMTGITRHVEVNSDADQAYDTAFDHACRIGWGYFRIVTDYIREDSFDQDIYIRRIENPFSVYFDPNSNLPDGSDAERCLITDLMSKSAFKKEYPGAEMNGFTAQSTGDVAPDWITKEDIRVAEYFEIEKRRERLVMLSDGTISWADRLPPPAVLEKAGIHVTGDRESYRKKVMWHKVSAFETLETKELPGKWIPVIPVYGDQTIIDGKRRRFGLVRYARDPQQMYNYWRTAMTESVAMAPKAKWLMAEGQDEGHENEWARANISAFPVLRYKTRDADGTEVGKPERLQPEGPPEGAMEAASAIAQDLQAVIGIFDPAMGKPSGPKSGKAIRAEQGQSEQSNFHYFDNLTRSIKHAGRIILDYTPVIYDQPGRITRIIGDDGKPDLITINNKTTDEQGIDRILHDVTVGNYDVVMDVGPSFNSRREETVAALSTLVQASPDLMKIAGDVIVRNMDFPGAELIADRLAAANPMAQIDDKSDVPPKAQMMIKGLQQQLQQAQQQMQAMSMEIKYKGQLEQFKQTEETKREHMRATVKAHDTEVWSKEERDQVASVERTKLHDTMTKAISSQNVEEIKQAGQLMLHHLDTKRLSQTAAIQDRQTEAAR